MLIETRVTDRTGQSVRSQVGRDRPLRSYIKGDHGHEVDRYLLADKLDIGLDVDAEADVRVACCSHRKGINLLMISCN